MSAWIRRVPCGEFLVVLCVVVTASIGADTSLATAAGLDHNDAVAESGNQEKKAQARKVAERFLVLATGDGWLSDAGRVEIGRLTGYPHAYGEAMIHSVTVILGYQILDTTVSGRTAVVTVEYDELGRLEDIFYKFKERRRKNRVSLTLESVNKGSWTLRDFGWSSPHIHWTSAMKHLEREAETAYNKTYFLRLAKEVEKAAQSRQN